MVLDLRFFDIVFHSHFHFVEVEFFFGRVGVVDLLHRSTTTYESSSS